MNPPGNGTYLFRCNATRQNGLGHLARCLALAEALRSMGQKAIFAGKMNDVAQDLLREAEFEHHPLETQPGSAADADAYCSLARSYGTSRLFADDYRIGVSWHRRLNANGYSACVYDDFALLADYSACAGVVNFTVEAAQLSYPTVATLRLAIGPSYFPAREALVEIRRRRSAMQEGSVPKVRRILVAIGGTDHHGFTLRVLDALDTIAQAKGDPARYEIRAICAPDLLADKDLQQRHGPRLLPIARSLASHYDWADVCISGGGLIKYECAYLGIPAAILSQSVEQQTETEQFVGLGLGVDMGWLPAQEILCEKISALLDDSTRLNMLRQRGAQFFPATSHTNVASFVIDCFEQSTPGRQAAIT